MSSFVYNCAKAGFLNGSIDLDTHDIRAALVMANTTCDTDNDGISFVAGFTTLDEQDGSGYVRKALSNETVTKDDTNDRGAFSADNVTWTALGAGTRAVAGVLIYKHVTNDADSIPIMFLEFSATPDGNNFVLKWNGGSTAGDLLRAV